MRLIASSLVPLKVLQLQVLKNIGSTMPRPSGPSPLECKLKRSTPHAVSCLTHDLIAHLGKGCKAFKAVFLDFSNALSTLPRQGLLSKFAAPSLPYWLVKWVHNCFTGCSQHIWANSKVSNAVQNNCDVLQGAVLSLFFFTSLHTSYISLNYWLPFLKHR